jgi:hypothetical protein
MTAKSLTIETAAGYRKDDLESIADLWREFGLERPCVDGHEWAFVPPGRFERLQSAEARAGFPHGLRICTRCGAGEPATAEELAAFRRGEYEDVLYVDDVEWYLGRAAGGNRTRSKKVEMIKRHEETLAYDLKAFDGVGGPVVISEGLAPGSGEFTVFIRKPNGVGLRHVRGAPQGSIESCREFVRAKIRSGRYRAWSAEQQRAAGYDRHAAQPRHRGRPRRRSRA